MSGKFLLGTLSAVTVLAFSFSCTNESTDGADVSQAMRTVVMDGYPKHLIELSWGSPEWNESIGNNPLTIAGRVFERGLGTHAHSELRLDLFGETKRFSAFVGVDDEMMGTGASIEFVVKGDDKELWRSGVMSDGDAAKKVDVDLTGIKLLKLIVTDGGNGIGSDHANWCDPVFTVTGRDPKPVWFVGEKIYEKIMILKAFEDGGSKATSKDVLGALQYITSKHNTIPKDDTSVRPILDYIAENNELPESMRSVKSGAVAAKSDIVYLDELQISKFTVGYGSAGRNISVVGAPLSVGGKAFERGVGVHAESRANIILGGNAKRFSAFVGVNDNMTSEKANLEFVVIGDGKELYRSGELEADDDAKKIDVDLTGVNELQLLVLPAKNGKSCDHGTWGDAHFELANRVMPYAVLPEQTEEEKYTAISWKRPIARLGLSLRNIREMELPAREVRISPAAKYFPGLVGESVERVTKTVTVDLSKPFWTPTGLYAAPGEVITVEIPEEYANFGLGVQISSFIDKLYHKPIMNRMPNIARRVAITSAKTEAANAYGGLVYIVVPSTAKPYSDGQWGSPKIATSTPIKVVISGAVKAPYYYRGETDINEWRESIRKIDVPVAELVGEHMSIQLPARLIRDTDNPDEIMEFWDEVQIGQAYVAGWDAPKFRMPFTLDRQISAGSGHSGYPIMAYENWSGGLLNVAKVKADGGWGQFHELGHNHQWTRGWTFQGQGEVTVNLFSLYNNDKLCGWEMKTRDLSNDKKGWRRMMDRETHLVAMRKYFSTDPKVPGKYNEAGADARLMIYFQIIERFGWEAIRKVNASYRPDQNPEFPSSDKDRGGEYVVRLSKIVGHNLYPYFKGWGLEMPEDTEARIGELPVWMPELVKDL